MTKLQRLYAEQGQSPWLDNLTRAYLRDGTLAAHGRRRESAGVTANPTIFARAIEGSADYDEQFASLTAAGVSVEDAYWELVIDDVTDALAVLRPVFDAAAAPTGSCRSRSPPSWPATPRQRSPRPARCTSGSTQPNLFVKIPATAEGVPAIEAMIAEGRSINITLIFSLARYAEVIEAYLRGLEAFVDARRRPVDGPQRRLVLRQPGRHRGRPAAGSHRHRRGAGVARPSRGRPGQARLPAVPASGSPARGGSAWPTSARTGNGRCGRRRPPRTRPTPTPSTSTSLIGPDTVNTLPETTIAAFEDHGTRGPHHRHRTWTRRPT